MTQKTEIEFELSETIAYCRRGEHLEAFCPRCEENVEMAAPQIAAILAHSNEREVFRRLEAGDVHFIEADRVLVCLNSLSNYQQRKEMSEK